MTQNMTRGKPLKLIILFSIPLLIGNVFQQFYNMADTFIVGRTLGLTALAAVGSTGSLTFLITGFAIGVSTGMSIITAQRYGANDMAGVRRSLAASILLTFAISLVLTAASVPFTGTLLNLLQTPESMYADAYSYMAVNLWCIFAPMLYNVFANFLRAVGDSKTPLYYLVFACIINIILDYVLILYFDMGTAGAAVATVIAQLSATALCAVSIFRSGSIFRLSRQDFKDALSDLLPHLHLGLPMGFQSSIIAVGTVVLQFALNGLGEVSVAAFTAAQKIDGFATMPVASIGSTMATYAAQNYGAGCMHRIKKGVRQCAIIAVVIALVMGLVNIVFGARLAALFLGIEGEVVSLAHEYLVINGVSYFVLALLYVYRYTLQGLGYSSVPTFAGVMELIMRSFAAVALAGAFGFAGASAAGPLAWVGSAVPLMVSYMFIMRKMLRKNAGAIQPGATEIV